MLRIGLTGGIGSGKSTVARIFEVLGIPVYYADDAAKRLMNEDATLRKEISLIFGAGAYRDNKLNKKYLAGIVFNDPEKLRSLNALVHPATLLDAKKWLNIQTSPYAIKEAALIFESGANKDLDYVIGVSSPLPLRTERIVKRDSLTEEEIHARMDKQMDEMRKLEMCDFIVVNDEEQLLLPQVLNLHKNILMLSEAQNS